MPSSMRWLVALVIWSIPTLLFGCSCVEYGTRRPCPFMRDASDVIFAGTLLAIENPPVSPDPPNQGRLKDRLDRHGIHSRSRKRFRVHSQSRLMSFRGAATATVAFAFVSARST